MQGEYRGPSIAQLVLGILGWATLFMFGLGLIFLFIVYFWNFIDLFLLPGIAKEQEKELRSEKATLIRMNRREKEE